MIFFIFARHIFNVTFNDSTIFNPFSSFNNCFSLLLILIIVLCNCSRGSLSLLMVTLNDFAEPFKAFYVSSILVLGARTGFLNWLYSSWSWNRFVIIPELRRWKDNIVFILLNHLFYIFSRCWNRLPLFRNRFAIIHSYDFRFFLLLVSSTTW